MKFTESRRVFMMKYAFLNCFTAATNTQYSQYSRQIVIVYFVQFGKWLVGNKNNDADANQLGFCLISEYKTNHSVASIK